MFAEFLSLEKSEVCSGSICFQVAVNSWTFRSFAPCPRISGVPNAVERLDREGLKVIQTTAGKWKRTIDPFQAPTPEALAKAEEDPRRWWQMVDG